MSDDAQKPCPDCQSLKFTDEYGTSGVHAGKRVCAECGRFLRWLPKKGNEGKARRPAGWRKAVSNLGRGCCELCLRKAEELPAPQSLIAHQVFPDELEVDSAHTWIVCTSCQKLIQHQRTYLGHYNAPTEEQFAAPLKPEGVA